MKIIKILIAPASVFWGSHCLPGLLLSWVLLTDPGCLLRGTEICQSGCWQMPSCPQFLCPSPRDGQSLSCSPLHPPRLRELCVKLMFLHPVDYGRKAEELLWRKVYYEVIQLIKTNKKVRGGQDLGKMFV